jgi:lipid-A-disaccharide synthase
LLRAVQRQLRRAHYDLIVLVDYPGFHLAVARAAKRLDLPVLNSIAPQLWAWGSWRVRRLRAAVDRLAVILPFEEPFFRARGMDTTFVGHPLAEQPALPSRDSARQVLGLRPDQPVLALLPGSRKSEMARLWPLFRQTARLLQEQVSDLAVVVAGIGGFAYPESEGFIVREGDSGLACRAADTAVCKSGTATLQAAFADTPLVVVYRVHPFTHAVARKLVRVPWIGLVNLIADREVAPELIQSRATARRLADTVRPLLDPNGTAAMQQRAELAVVRSQLGGPGTSRRVARIALEMVA